jgi:hypothetical protein
MMDDLLQPEGSDALEANEVRNAMVPELDVRPLEAKATDVGDNDWTVVRRKESFDKAIVEGYLGEKVRTGRVNPSLADKAAALHRPFVSMQITQDLVDKFGRKAWDAHLVSGLRMTEEPADIELATRLGVLRPSAICQGTDEFISTTRTHALNLSGWEACPTIQVSMSAYDELIEVQEMFQQRMRTQKSVRWVTVKPASGLSST